MSEIEYNTDDLRQYFADVPVPQSLEPENMMQHLKNTVPPQQVKRGYTRRWIAVAAMLVIAVTVTLVARGTSFRLGKSSDSALGNTASDMEMYGTENEHSAAPQDPDSAAEDPAAPSSPDESEGDTGDVNGGGAMGSDQESLPEDQNAAPAMLPKSAQPSAVWWWGAVLVIAAVIVMALVLMRHRKSKKQKEQRNGQA